MGISKKKKGGGGGILIVVLVVALPREKYRWCDNIVAVSLHLVRSHLLQILWLPPGQSSISSGNIYGKCLHLFLICIYIIHPASTISNHGLWEWFYKTHMSTLNEDCEQNMSLKMCDADPFYIARLNYSVFYVYPVFRCSAGIDIFHP